MKKINKVERFEYDGKTYKTEAEAMYAKDVATVVELIKTLIRNELESRQASKGVKNPPVNVEAYLAKASIFELVSLVLKHKEEFARVLMETGR